MTSTRLEVKCKASSVRGRKLKAENVPRTRTNPAVTVAIEAGFAIRNHVHPYRNPGNGPYASRTYTYSPPANGRTAPNSAYVNAPKNESNPPTIQARYTNPAEPTACIISAGTRKIPLPMIVPATIDVACQTFSPRINSGARRIPTGDCSLVVSIDIVDVRRRARCVTRLDP